MKLKKTLSIVLFSDTHSKEYMMDDLPDADIAIFAGDMSTIGYLFEIENFLKWYSSQKPKHKVFIAGNHDYFFHFDNPKSMGSQEKLDEIMPDNLTYLYQSSVTIEGLKIWGSPWTPFFLNWAFNALPGEDIQKYWKEIEVDSDIIVTHGPVVNTKLDICLDRKRSGCPSLMNKVLDIMPALHVCGHIHEAYGTEEIEIDGKMIVAVNCSVLNRAYKMRHKPVIVEMDKDKNVTILDEGYLDIDENE